MASVLAVVVLFVALVVGSGLIFGGSMSPAEVLKVYVNRLNAGDFQEAVDLTVYSLMGSEAHSAEVQGLADIFEDLGIYRLTVNFAEAVPYQNLARHDLFVISEVQTQIEQEMNISIPRDYSVIGAVWTNLTLSYADGDTPIEIVASFLNVQSSWYIVSHIIRL